MLRLLRAGQPARRFLKRVSAELLEGPSPIEDRVRDQSSPVRLFATQSGA